MWRRIGAEIAARLPGPRGRLAEAWPGHRFRSGGKGSRWRAGTRAILSGASFINRDGSALEQLIIETSHCFFGLRAVIELYKSKATRSAGLPIRSQMDVGERADCREELFQLCFGGIIREIPNKKTDR